jgi:hypothetical protein
MLVARHRAGLSVLSVRDGRVDAGWRCSPVGRCCSRRAIRHIVPRCMLSLVLREASSVVARVKTPGTMSVLVGIGGLGLVWVLVTLRRMTMALVVLLAVLVVCHSVRRVCDTRVCHKWLFQRCWPALSCGHIRPQACSEDRCCLFWSVTGSEVLCGSIIRRLQAIASFTELGSGNRNVGQVGRGPRRGRSMTVTAVVG